MTDAEIRAEYRRACFGAGAGPRREARAVLDAEIATRGLAHVGELLDPLGLDIGAYFATRPI